MNTIQKALQAAADSGGDLWARPVGWRGAGCAYSVRSGNTRLVPGHRGAVVGMTADIASLTGEWETVAPDVVLKERQE